MGINQQLGFKDETTVGTAVTPDRFSEFLSEDIVAEMSETQSMAMHRGRRGINAAGRARGYVGSNGPVQLEVLDVGFDFWMKHILGSIDAGVDGDDGETAYTAVLGDLCGKSFTLESNKGLGACGNTDRGFRWGGCKVSTWSITCAVDAIVQQEMEIVTTSEITNLALATASYPVGAHPLFWLGASLVCGGVTVPVTQWKVSGDNKLNINRKKLGLAGRQEPVQMALVDDLQVEFICDWIDLSHYNRFRDATDSNLTEVVATATGANLIGDTTFPSLAITLPNVSIKAPAPGVSNLDVLQQTVTGTALYKDTDELIEMVYTTAQV